MAFKKSIQLIRWSQKSNRKSTRCLSVRISFVFWKVSTFSFLYFVSFSRYLLALHFSGYFARERLFFFCFLWSFAREISAGRPKFIHLRMLDVWLLPWFYGNRKGAVSPSGGSQTWTGKAAKIESTKTQARVDSTVCCNASATLVPLINDHLYHNWV